MLKVSSTDFDVNNIRFGEVKSQKAKTDSGPSVEFTTIPLEYIYPNGMKGKVRIALPENLPAPLGLSLRLPSKTYKRKGEYYTPKKEEASLLISFDANGEMSTMKDDEGNPIPLQEIYDNFSSNDLENPGLMLQLTQHCAKFVGENKKTIKGYAQKVSVQEMVTGLTGRACYPGFPTKDGEPQTDKALCYWFNVNTYSFEGRQIRAKFIAPSSRFKGGVEIPFEDLERKRLKVCPIYEVQDIFVGSDKWKIRGRIISCIVTDIQEVSQEDIQHQEVEQMSADTALVARLEQQLAALKVKKESTPTASSSTQIIADGDGDDIPGMDVKSMMAQFGDKLN